MLNKEYSDKGSPYSEYYMANNQVVSKKMFGLHGLVTPGREEALNTNGGLMYYQYDGRNSVTELTDRNGDEIEHYRYDAFGGIYTGVTAPYNTVGYTGQEYDDKSGLVQMDARWYNPSVGRFMTQDSYQGDKYNPQSLNQYSYVMNNPVNMWDPTGHVPSWVGDSSHLTTTPDGTHAVDLYILQSSYSNSSGWNLIDKITSASQITYKYKSTIFHTWTYSHDHWSYNITTDEETGEKNYEVTSHTTGTSTYNETNCYYKDVVVKASEIAKENEQYIRNLAGSPPKNTDPPAVSISTLQVNGGPVKLLNPDEIILRNTGSRTSGEEALVAGAVQSELNDILNKNLIGDGWYGSDTAGAVAEFQKDLNLTANGKLDVKTFYQLENIYGQYSQYTKDINSYDTYYSDKPDLMQNRDELLTLFRNSFQGLSNSVVTYTPQSISNLESQGAGDNPDAKYVTNVVALSDKDDLPIVGHLATLFVYNDDSATYYSYMANNNNTRDIIDAVIGTSDGYLGKVELNSTQVDEFLKTGKDLNDIYGVSMNYVPESGKEEAGKRPDEQDYDRYINISVTKDEGEKMLAKANDIYNDKTDNYSLFTNNCATVVQDILSTGNDSFDDIFFTFLFHTRKEIIPNNTYNILAYNAKKYGWTAEDIP